MGAQELSKAVLFAVHAAAAHAILAAFVTLFLLHEAIGILIELLSHALMILEIGLQRRMVVYELLVFRQRRIAAELFGDFLVFVKKLIEADHLAMVGVTRVLAIVVVLTVVVAVTHVVAICVAVIGVTIPSVVVAAIVIARAIALVVSASVVAIEVTIASVFIVVEAVFLPHEGIRILIQALLDVRMLLQISLQRWMVLQELLIF